MPIVIIAAIIALFMFRKPRQEVILVQAPPRAGVTIIDKRKTLIDKLYPLALVFWAAWFVFAYLNQ